HHLQCLKSWDRLIRRYTIRMEQPSVSTKPPSFSFLPPHKCSTQGATVMSRRSSRRRFLKTAAGLGAGYWALGGVAPRESRSANEKVQFACVGVGGKGTSDSQDAGRSGDVVAICDIDDKNLAL